MNKSIIEKQQLAEVLTIKLTQQSRAQTGELENLDSDPASVLVMLRKLFNLLVTQVPQL